jgi:DNA-binding CsgD family transcriptional regulator
VPAITFSAGLGADNPVLSTLTPRQRDILKMIADGKSSADMATTLGVSQPTITFHRANLRRKLGVDTEWGLVRFAILMQVRENEKHGAG